MLEIQNEISQHMNEKKDMYKYRVVVDNSNGYSKHFVCCQLNSVEILLDEWESIVQEVAMEIQSVREPMIERMNVYLILFVRGKLVPSAKRMIENDRYSSRKVVVEYSNNSYTDQELLEFVKKRFLSIELTDEETEAPSSFSKLLESIDNKLYDTYKKKLGKSSDELLEIYSADQTKAVE